MHQIQLRLAQGLILRLIQNILFTVTKLLVKPSICLDVNDPVEVISL